MYLYQQARKGTLQAILGGYFYTYPCVSCLDGKTGNKKSRFLPAPDSPCHVLPLSLSDRKGFALFVIPVDACPVGNVPLSWRCSPVGSLTSLLQPFFPRRSIVTFGQGNAYRTY